MSLRDTNSIESCVALRQDVVPVLHEGKEKYLERLGLSVRGLNMGISDSDFCLLA